MRIFGVAAPLPPDPDCGTGPHHSPLPSKPAALQYAAIYPGPISGTIETEHFLLFTPIKKKKSKCEAV